MKWWIAVVRQGRSLAILPGDEHGFVSARALAQTNGSEDVPCNLYWAYGEFEIAPLAIVQNITVTAPATEVGSR